MTLVATMELAPAKTWDCRKCDGDMFIEAKGNFL